MSRALAAAAARRGCARCWRWPAARASPRRDRCASGGDLRLQRADDGVSVIGEPPRPGATPSQIINGFLDSSADFQNDHEVARLYLTTAASRAWRPQAGTQVYDKTELSVEQSSADASTFVFDAPAVGDIAGDGDVQPGRGRPAGDPAVPAGEGERPVADRRSGRRAAALQLRARRHLPPGLALLPRPVRGDAGAGPRAHPGAAGPEHQGGGPAAARPDLGAARRRHDRLPGGDVAGRELGAGDRRGRHRAAGRHRSAGRRHGAPADVRAAGLDAQAAVGRHRDPDPRRRRGPAGQQCRRRAAEHRLAHVRPRPGAQQPLGLRGAGRAGRPLPRGQVQPGARRGRRRRGRGSGRPRSPSTTRGWRRSAPTATACCVGPMQDGETLDAAHPGGDDSDFSSPSWDRDNGLWVVDRADGAPAGTSRTAPPRRSRSRCPRPTASRSGASGSPGTAPGRRCSSAPAGRPGFMLGRRPPGGDRRPPGRGRRAAVARVGDGAAAGPARRPGHGVGRRDARRGAGQPGGRVAAAVRGERGRLALPRHRARAGTGRGGLDRRRAAARRHPAGGGHVDAAGSGSSPPAAAGRSSGRAPSRPTPADASAVVHTPVAVHRCAAAAGPRVLAAARLGRCAPSCVPCSTSCCPRPAPAAARPRRRGAPPAPGRCAVRPGVRHPTRARRTSRRPGR